MSNLNGMVMKYVVLKTDDCDKYLWESQKEQLSEIVKEINECREHDRKTTNNKYLVINTDEPYADEIIEIMKRHGHWG